MTDEEEVAKKSSGSARKRWMRLLGWLFVLLSLFFWWRAIRQEPLAETLAAAQGHEAWLVAALILATGYLIGQAVVWRALVADLSVRIAWPVAMRAWMLSNLGRYLPGSVWHLVGRVEAGRDAGVGRASGTLGVALEQGLQLVSALAIVALSLPFWPADSIVRHWAWLALLVPLGFLAMHPRAFYPAVNTLLVRLGQPALPRNLGYRRLVGFTLADMGVHLCNGLTLACCAVALGAPLALVPAMVGAALFAWTVGYVTLLAPGGLGVREGMVTAALTPLLGRDVVAVAAVAALLWRLANVVTEVGCAAGFTWLWRRWAGRAPAPAADQNEA
jgi:hypothetical protein